MEASSSAPRRFCDLKLNSWLVDQCKLLGLKEPTPVQSNCIPEILIGRDCLACAKTGSGKTAAFALPILQSLCQDPHGIFALILTPTRELATQIGEQFRTLGKPIGLKDAVIIGGVDMVEQGRQLAQRPHIVVATPGRLADHIDTAGITFRNIKFLVFDEADRLLADFSFAEQLKIIMEVLPQKRQTLLFSATMTNDLEELKQIALSNPFFWEAPSMAKSVTVEKLQQKYILIPGNVKDAYMVHIINEYQQENPQASIIIFTNTCLSCQVISTMLVSLGLPCVSLHSMRSQKKRLASLNSFKSRNVKLMVATDVASRGLDIPSVEFVLNYDIPTVPKNYIHRVGRTARAGRGGLALSMVTQYDVKLVHAAEAMAKTKLTQHLVSEKKVLKIMTKVAVARSTVQNRLDANQFGEREEINKRKKLILEGKYPDVEESANKRRKVQRISARRKSKN